MRVSVCALTASLGLVLGACNTYRVAGAVTYGRVRDLAPADIEEAVAVYKAKTQQWYKEVAQIQVVSRNELRLYSTVGDHLYTVMERKNGHWRIGGLEGVVVTE